MWRTVPGYQCGSVAERLPRTRSPIFHMGGLLWCRSRSKGRSFFRRYVAAAPLSRTAARAVLAVRGGFFQGFGRRRPHALDTGTMAEVHAAADLSGALPARRPPETMTRSSPSEKRS